MKSFFGAIQHWFGADCYGRHLGLILQEIGRHQRKALASFISAECGIPMAQLRDARFEAEYTFHGTAGPRRADLAVFAGDDDTPLALVEIKYHDKPLAETATKAAQMTDYRAWAARERRPVLLLSREPYAEAGIVCRRWNTLARHLRPYGEQSDLVGMLVEFLEEEGNVMQDIDKAVLLKYLKRHVCNRSQGANNIAGPAAFGALLKNLQLMSGTFHLYVKDAWRDAGLKVEGEHYDKRSKSASIDFRVRGRLKSVADTASVTDEHECVRDELKDGGYVTAFARHSLGHAPDRLRLAYGVYFDVSPGNTADAPPATWLFAELYGTATEKADMNIYVERKIDFAWVTDKAELRADKVEEHLGKLICQAIGTALDAKLALLPQQARALKMLCKALPSMHAPHGEAA